METPTTTIAAAAQGGRTESLCAWSLGLSVVAWFCSFVLAGLAAIVCGHSGLSRVKAAPARRGRGVGIAGLVLGYLSLLNALVALALPYVETKSESAALAVRLNNVRQIALAIQTASIDSTAADEPLLGFPADAGFRSAAEVRKMLIDGGYLKEEELDEIGFDELEIGNVSSSDPADTILIKSKPDARGRTAIFLKGGDGGLARAGQLEIGRAPPRTPAFLE